MMCYDHVYIIPLFTANNVDPDQTQHSVASDLGLHSLPMSLLRNLGLNGLMDDRF